jgi:hypothetical protein
LVAAPVSVLALTSLKIASGVTPVAVASHVGIRSAHCSTVALTPLLSGSSPDKPLSSLHSFTSNAYGRDTKTQHVVVGPRGAGALDAEKPQHVVSATQGSFGVHDTTGAFRFSASPLGFITCPITQTMETGVFDVLSEKIKFFARRRKLLKEYHAGSPVFAILSRSMASTVGFKTKTYRSGETTGGMFYTGKQSKCHFPLRPERIESTELTAYARTKIRRSVECSETFLKYFWTLTFSPEHCHPWQKYDDGSIRHDYAKYKLRKFLDTCRHKQKRLKRDLSYVWVAEIQTESTNNIHFHILIDQFFDVKWITKIWAQAPNSADVRPPLKNPEHAANYIRKYMSKDENSLIKGNRYNVSSKLHAATEPKERTIMAMSTKDNHEMDGEPIKEMLDLLQSMKEEIESRGGHVLDFGFHVPKGRSAKKYKDKKTGEQKESRAVHPRLGRDIINAFVTAREPGNVPF